MYSTCIFCSTRLGENRVIEEFPVGRRLAFDPGKGRLWALCPRCRQWNLSPIEERWEALESLERLYRDTPRRFSTEEIGLARHAEGLEVVRIGRPTRPEYAAWRYGGEMLRRRRRALVVGGAAAAAGALVVGGAMGGVLVSGAYAVVNVSANWINLYRNMIRTSARVDTPDEGPVRLTYRHAQHARVERTGDDGWAMIFPHRPAPGSAPVRVRRWARGLARLDDDPVSRLEGDAAIRAAGRILPALNRSGASRRRVEEAARFVESSGSVDAAFRKAARAPRSAWMNARAPMRLPEHALFRLPANVRLGLEMAAQEESERRALEGELARLAAEWRDAEEVAAIADDLLLPRRVGEFLRTRREWSGPGSGTHG